MNKAICKRCNQFIKDVCSHGECAEARHEGYCSTRCRKEAIVYANN